MIAELHRNLGIIAIAALAATILFNGQYWDYTRLIVLVFGILGVVVFIMGLAVTLASPKVRPNYPLLFYVLVLSLAIVYASTKRMYSDAHALLSLVSVIGLTHLYIVGARGGGEEGESSSIRESEQRG